jgi:hypothetical protein
MRSSIRLAGIITLGLAISGCASINVSSYVASGTDLRQHRTYNWAPVVARPTGDPRLDNNRFFQERVQAAVEEQLANRGFEKTASPDLLVRYHAGVAQEIYTTGTELIGGYCEDCQRQVYDEGTLVIDLVDARNDRLVWRGRAEGGVDGVINDQKSMEERIDEAVARIMRTLPL